jgi:hypothetical protein
MEVRAKTPEVSCKESKNADSTSNLATVEKIALMH